MDTSSHEVRISVQGLALGMYVSRLDRPWLETPFPLHGLALDSDDAIARLRRICSHVWVDTLRGIAPDSRYLAFEDTGPSAPPQGEFEQLRKTDWSIRSEFKAELQQAEHVHAMLEGSIAEVMEDLQDGKHLDLGRLKDGVDAMIDSILRNPTAFVWLK